MELVIFDIDGTLTDTEHVDEHSIIGALEDVLHVDGLSTDWSTYRTSTDGGIVDEVIERVRGHVDDSVRETVMDRFYALLEDFYTTSPDLFRPMKGAQTILPDLHARGTAVALATGSWRDSALFKLRVAGIEHVGVPMATSDDSVHRDRIIMKAVERAMQSYSRRTFERVIYVGDGVWDARAARVLDLPFIGIGTDDKAERLRNEGAWKVYASPADLLAADRTRLHSSTV
jgi:phosphoglycolate phosphatase-like HAD superfamily hydrolase